MNKIKYLCIIVISCLLLSLGVTTYAYFKTKLDSQLGTNSYDDLNMSTVEVENFDELFMLSNGDDIINVKLKNDIDFTSDLVITR